MTSPASPGSHAWPDQNRNWRSRPPSEAVELHRPLIDAWPHENQGPLPRRAGLARPRRGPPRRRSDGRGRRQRGPGRRIARPHDPGGFAGSHSRALAQAWLATLIDREPGPPGVGWTAVCDEHLAAAMTALTRPPCSASATAKCSTPNPTLTASEPSRTFGCFAWNWTSRPIPSLLSDWKRDGSDKLGDPAGGAIG